MNSREWWYLISKEICDDYVHSQEDEYNEAPNEFLAQNINEKTINIQNPNPGR